MSVRVVIADDQTVVREGLRSLLSIFDEVSVVGVAASAEEALELVAAGGVDVVLSDLRMPGIGGVEGIRRLAALEPPVPAVALTTYDDDATIVDALAAGAAGFLTKDADPDAVVAALTAAAAGRSLLDRRAVSAMLRHSAPAPPRAPEVGLTPREVEVVTLVARGLSNSQLAKELVLSQATIKTHLNHVLAKTGCRDRAQLVSWAYGHGLV